mmetsp:Transcript_21045/g.66495  ORF Transcript_21045/g.66495 Transcript_21045/m.66495 type:complete len:256 (-) Transcript_21045:705-1472(-)
MCGTVTSNLSLKLGNVLTRCVDDHSQAHAVGRERRFKLRDIPAQRLLSSDQWLNLGCACEGTRELRTLLLVRHLQRKARGFELLPQIPLGGCHCSGNVLDDTAQATGAPHDVLMQGADLLTGMGPLLRFLAQGVHVSSDVSDEGFYLRALQTLKLSCARNLLLQLREGIFHGHETGLVLLPLHHDGGMLNNLALLQSLQVPPEFLDLGCHRLASLHAMLSDALELSFHPALKVAQLQLVPCHLCHRDLLAVELPS